MREKLVTVRCVGESKNYSRETGETIHNFQFADRRSSVEIIGDGTYLHIRASGEAPEFKLGRCYQLTIEEVK